MEMSGMNGSPDGTAHCILRMWHSLRIMLLASNDTMDVTLTGILGPAFSRIRSVFPFSSIFATSVVRHSVAVGTSYCNALHLEMLRIAGSLRYSASLNVHIFNKLAVDF